jgi:hypothetical protein
LRRHKRAVAATVADAPSTENSHWQAEIDHSHLKYFYLAQSGHPDAHNQCPLLGVKRTLPEPAPMSAFDPKRTFDGGIGCNAK